MMFFGLVALVFGSQVRSASSSFAGADAFTHWVRRARVRLA